METSGRASPCFNMTIGWLLSLVVARRNAGCDCSKAEDQCKLAM
jgi:hypothetical protein